MSPEARHPLADDRYAYWSGAGKLRDFSYAVLRRSYCDPANSIEAYSRRKLRHDAGPLDAALPRRDVRAVAFLVPPACPDLLAGGPGLLWSLVDGESWADDLALLVTLWHPGARALHLAFRATRDWVQAELCDARGLAALLIQHDPSALGKASDAHAHVIATARAVTGTGLGAFASVLVNGDGLKALHPSWLAHVAQLPAHRRWS